ncbi:MAG: hypothetical protein WBE26_16680, partial [Phycisphaerae bacterium]
MLDTGSMNLALGLPSLATAYWICLIIGGGLLVISSIAGSDTDAGLDADVDTDLSVDGDVDVDVDAGHAHASSLATWFSMQFAVFFLAVFGVIGVTMTYMTTQTDAVIFVCALM